MRIKTMVSMFLLSPILVLLSVTTALANTNYSIEYIHRDSEKLCGAVPKWNISAAKPYNPNTVSSSQKYDRTSVYDQRLLVCMKTSLPQYLANNGIGWVVSPEFSRVGYSSNGAFYLGTDDGQYLRCHNKIYQIVMIEESFENPPSTVVPSATPLPTPAPVATPLVCDEGQTLSADGRYCVAEKVVYVQPCAEDLSISGKSRFIKDRVGGGFWKKLFSFGLSATGTLIAGGDVSTAIKNGAIGVLIQTGQTMINPSEGAIKLSGAGLSKEVVLPRGQNFSWSSGGKTYQLVWKNDVATVYGTTIVAGNNYTSACYSYNPKDASNMGVYISGGSNQSVSTGADKLQTQVQVRPSVAPTTGFSVGTLGYCSRPVAGQPAQACQVLAGGLIVELGNISPNQNLPIIRR